jgi:hypothetical protein
MFQGWIRQSVHEREYELHQSQSQVRGTRRRRFVFFSQPRFYIAVHYRVSPKLVIFVSRASLLSLKSCSFLLSSSSCSRQRTHKISLCLSLSLSLSLSRGGGGGGSDIGNLLCSSPLCEKTTVFFLPFFQAKTFSSASVSSWANKRTFFFQRHQNQ